MSGVRPAPSGLPKLLRYFVRLPPAPPGPPQTGSRSNRSHRQGSARGVRSDARGGSGLAVWFHADASCCARNWSLETTPVCRAGQPRRKGLMHSGAESHDGPFGIETHRASTLQPRVAPRVILSEKCAKPRSDSEPDGRSVAFAIARTLFPLLGRQGSNARRVGGPGARDDGQGGG